MAIARASRAIGAASSQRRWTAIWASASAPRRANTTPPWTGMAVVLPMVTAASTTQRPRAGVSQRGTGCATLAAAVSGAFSGGGTVGGTGRRISAHILEQLLDGGDTLGEASQLGGGLPLAGGVLLDEVLVAPRVLGA